MTTQQPTNPWVLQILKEMHDEEERIANLTPEERAAIVAEDRKVLDPFLTDLRALRAKHPNIKWYLDPGDPLTTDPPFDGIEFVYGLAVEWVYCEEYPVLRPIEVDS